METQIAVPVATRKFLELSEFLRANGDSRDPVKVIEGAIDYWLENAAWKPELLSQGAGAGYQWKELHLPHGTEVRMQYKGDYHYAKVVGDQVLYDDKPFTPGALANHIAGSSRSAWRDLWLRFPGEEVWRPAADYRGNA